MRTNGVPLFAMQYVKSQFICRDSSIEIAVLIGYDSVMYKRLLVSGLILTLLVTGCTQQSVETSIPVPVSEAAETPSQAEATGPNQTPMSLPPPTPTDYLRKLERLKNPAVFLITPSFTWPCIPV